MNSDMKYNQVVKNILAGEAITIESVKKYGYYNYLFEIGCYVAERLEIVEQTEDANFLLETKMLAFVSDFYDDLYDIDGEVFPGIQAKLDAYKSPVLFKPTSIKVQYGESHGNEMVKFPLKKLWNEVDYKHIQDIFEVAIEIENELNSK